jgi:hypothetical protein
MGTFAARSVVGGAALSATDGRNGTAASDQGPLTLLAPQELICAENALKDDKK